jgi:hypothetical protein
MMSGRYLFRIEDFKEAARLTRNRYTNSVSFIPLFDRLSHRSVSIYQPNSVVFGEGDDGVARMSRYRRAWQWLRFVRLLVGNAVYWVGMW